MIKRYIIAALLSLFVGAMTETGCSESHTKQTPPYDGKEYIKESSLTPAGEDPQAAAESFSRLINKDVTLSVPTYVTLIDNKWYIVDCYHDRVLYSEFDDGITLPLDNWFVMEGDLSHPHTIASDGQVYLVDDTENNRVLVYEKIDYNLINTQVFEDIGVRPHFSVYDEKTDTFYVLSSGTGELYCFRHTPDSSRVYLTDIKKIEQISDVYISSFSIIDGDIYFPSGVSGEGHAPQILQCDLTTMQIKKSYPVPDALAGMVQVTKIGDYYYITVSTDITGDQSYATLVRTRSLSDLAENEYEDIYADYFEGGGTPYNISSVGDTYFLTEHRLPGHSIWSFKVTDNNITDVKSLY